MPDWLAIGYLLFFLANHLCIKLHTDDQSAEELDFYYLLRDILILWSCKFFILQTLVQVPDLDKMIGLIDRLGKLGDVLEVAVTQYGDIHLQVSQTMVSIGSEYRKLRVIGLRGTYLNRLATIVGCVHLSMCISSCIGPFLLANEARPQVFKVSCLVIFYLHI